MRSEESLQQFVLERDGIWIWLLPALRWVLMGGTDVHRMRLTTQHLM